MGRFDFVGANDPVHMNVTKAFYDRGWNGINIEPLRTKCMLLQNERARDINLCVGIGSKREKLFLTAADLASSFSTNIVEKSEMKNRNKYIKAILTLTDVYEQYCGSGQQVHFCKIDVEDYEKEVLGGVKDWNAFRPWIFVVESAIPGTSIPCYEKWEHILVDNGYLFAYSSKIERYYVDERHEYLLERFHEIDKFIENNEIVKMVMENIGKSVVYERLSRQ